MWDKYLSGKTIGDIGSEDGVIIADEEYSGGCRITLEKCKIYYAITCGVYGCMVHTAFAGEDDYQSKYDSMKKDLQEFLDKKTTEDEEELFYEEFIYRY